MPFCNCACYDHRFDAETAEKELLDYRTNGVDSQTQAFLDCMAPIKIATDSMLLDVGGGIGVLGHELLKRGVTDVVMLEASIPYRDVARNEAEARGEGARWSFHCGDAVEIAEDLPMADIVTMHRVVCCYPDYDHLLRASASRCREFFVLSYPRDRWYMKIATFAENLYHRYKGVDFRVYAHSEKRMLEALFVAGFEVMVKRNDWIWATRVLKRRQA